MIWKLALTGIKSRLRDYLILFSGLIIASSIFYMFESMATNKDFLLSSNTVSLVVFVFHFGSILLAIITLVYILYANSFLMTMRQKSYALFMMLGAKTNKIAQMIFIETFLVGVVASVIGCILGIGLTTVVNSLLTNQLDIHVSHFTPLNVTSIIITLVFFTILFLLAALINAVQIVRKPILKLLKEQDTPTRLKTPFYLLGFQAVLGVGLLSIGYYVLTKLVTYKLFGLGIALGTITIGTFLLFNSVVIFILSLLKKVQNISMRKLNNFTISQISFRTREYTKILSMVAMLFALALGAITVGLGFRNQIPVLTNGVMPYDVVINNAQNMDQEKVDSLHPTLNVSYDSKEDSQAVYYIKEQFDQNPYLSNKFDSAGQITHQKSTSSDLEKDSARLEALRKVQLPESKEKEIRFLSQVDFDALGLKQTTIQVVKVEDYVKQMNHLKEIVAMNEKNNPSLGGANGENSFVQKVYIYPVYNTMFSGFEFMGFFLGIAFLTMLASCLMFKILSSANSDTVRYTMLRKIGTREHLLKSSIRKELGTLFLLPGILGIIHVLFGLKMFKEFLHNPYQGIWIPFSIFLGLYTLYYVVTVVIYTSVVLPKKK
jgi:Predicted ABC-type transport system involved in lysophospholipase L1 biosynthesis, permease component